MPHARPRVVHVPRRHAVACEAGITTIKISLNPQLRVEYGWGEPAMLAGPAVNYSAAGASVPSVPYAGAAYHNIWQFKGGTAVQPSKQHGHLDLYSGSPGVNSTATLWEQLQGQRPYPLPAAVSTCV